MAKNNAGEVKKSPRKSSILNELYQFADKYLSKHVTADPSEMHRELYRLYLDRIQKSVKKGIGSKLAFAAPRGHAKSTLTTIILPLWCVVYQKRKFIGVKGGLKMYRRGGVKVYHSG
jgi:hypothetical protein